MTEIERVLDAAYFMEANQGYMDIKTVSILSGMPEIIVENIFKEYKMGKYNA